MSNTALGLINADLGLINTDPDTINSDQNIRSLLNQLISCKGDLSNGFSDLWRQHEAMTKQLSQQKGMIQAMEANNSKFYKVLVIFC